MLPSEIYICNMENTLFIFFVVCCVFMIGHVCDIGSRKHNYSACRPKKQLQSCSLYYLLLIFTLLFRGRPTACLNISIEILKIKYIFQ